MKNRRQTVCCIVSDQHQQEYNLFWEIVTNVYAVKTDFRFPHWFKYSDFSLLQFHKIGWVSKSREKTWKRNKWKLTFVESRQIRTGKCIIKLPLETFLNLFVLWASTFRFANIIYQGGFFAIYFHLVFATCIA